MSTGLARMSSPEIRFKKEHLFVNKKKQKNFEFFDVSLSVQHGPEGKQKFFGSFFPKKNCLRTLAPRRHP
jgi:hypothetical protein